MQRNVVIILCKLCSDICTYQNIYSIQIKVSHGNEDVHFSFNNNSHWCVGLTKSWMTNTQKRNNNKNNKY